MPNVQMIAIFYNKIHSKFMTAADVFEQGKVLGEIYNISFATDKELTNEELIDGIKQSLEKDNIVSFITVKHTKCIPYVNPEVRIISSGTKWFMLHEWIRREFPFLDIELTEHVYIKSMKIK